MPYIKQVDRDKFSVSIKSIQEAITKNGITPGELNFIITTLCKTYLNRKGENYTFFNDVVGVLESVKQEFYRRSIVPYENKKIKENGDV